MNYELLAKQSIRDGEQRYTEDQIRSMIGAPSVQEETAEQERAERNECVCGVINCADEYAHTTSGW